MATQMLENGADLRWIQAMHASTHPAEQPENEKPDSIDNNSYIDTTTDTTKGVSDEYDPLQNR